jgi:uncharacterized protein YqeY
LKTRLEDDLKAAMRSGDTARRDTLRFALAAVHRESVDRRQAAVDKLIAEGKSESERATALAERDPSVLDDAGVQDVLQKQAKMRRDSIEAFRKGGRSELVAKEENELAIISEYLPKQLSDAEIRAIVARVISEAGAAGPRDMGKVMPKVLAETKDKADGKQVAAVVQSVLKEKTG